MPTVIRNPSAHPIARVRHGPTGPQHTRHPTPNEIASSLDVAVSEIDFSTSIADGVSANTIAAWFGNGVSPGIVEAIVSAALNALDIKRVAGASRA